MPSANYLSFDEVTENLLCKKRLENTASDSQVSTHVQGVGWNQSQMETTTAHCLQ